MATQPLDKRVSLLEQEVAALKKALAKEGAPKNWRRTVGMFEGDEMMQEIDRLTLAVRQEDRKMAAKRLSGRKPVSS
jgi:hypothetical protein